MGKLSARAGSIVFALIPALLVTGCAAAGSGGGRSGASGTVAGRVRTYYIAADEVLWDYAPQDRNVVAGRPFTDAEQVFVRNGATRIGDTYRKAVYRAYTDATFATLAPVPARDRYRGLLGPPIRAEVGDTVHVVFRNNTSRPASVHAHGVFYEKDAEGAPYDDGTAAAARADDAVAPGHTYTYHWRVPERAGPGAMDGTSVLWMYHSHTDEIADTNAGLLGPIVVTARGKARPDGTPTDVDREVFSYFSVIDENVSPYLAGNLTELAQPPHEVAPQDAPAFEESNLMHAINGFVYGNGPMVRIRKGERVRWYTFSLGTEVDLHTPHWHGNTATMMGLRGDMLELLPGSMKVADMRADAAGTWLFHCHVNDHIAAGMTALYRVET
jgi:FtsP/CotA-like multicopper oxidase with cupredoxin domain